MARKRTDFSGRVRLKIARDDFGSNIKPGLTGDARFSGDAGFSGNERFSGDVGFSRNARFSGDIAVPGDVGFSGQIGLGRAKAGRPAYARDPNQFSDVVLDVAGLSQAEIFALTTKQPQLIESLGGREKRPLHVHILSTNPEELENGKRMVPAARLLAGKAEKLRAPGVPTSGVQRTYPDGSRIKVFNNAGIVSAMVFPVGGVPPEPKKKKKREYEWDYKNASGEFLLIAIRGADPEGLSLPFYPPYIEFKDPFPVAYRWIMHYRQGARMQIWEPHAPSVFNNESRIIFRATTNQRLATPNDFKYQGKYRDFLDRQWSHRGAYTETFGDYWEAVVDQDRFGATAYGPMACDDHWVQELDYQTEYDFPAFLNAPHPLVVRRNGPLKARFETGVFSFGHVFPYPYVMPNGKYYDQVFVADPHEGLRGVAPMIPPPQWEPFYPPYTGAPPLPVIVNPYSRRRPKFFFLGNTLNENGIGLINEWPYDWEKEWRPAEPFIDGEYIVRPYSSGLQVLGCNILVVIGTGEQQVQREFAFPAIEGSSADGPGLAIDVKSKKVRIIEEAQWDYPFDDEYTQFTPPPEELEDRSEQ